MNKYLNIFVKTILIVSSMFLLFNIGLFLFLFHYSVSSSIPLKDKIIKTIELVSMSYSFFYFIIHGLIYGQKPYVPIAERENK